ncbi:MAG TPA: hypothetical protein VMX75_14685 [Spirochaetia bacterium]|nr:hypothetical protein [Spirochaetia bacterium]
MVYIFYLFRKEGESLIIHPFASPEKLTYNLENSTILGRYGTEPRVEALTLLKNDFYRTIELFVRNWVFDVRFIPKFLISAAVFLVVYFFLSFVIRDPLPFVDEIVGSIVAAFVTYFLMGRRDIRSDMASRKRLDLRTAADRICFQESEFVMTLEKALHENESGDVEKVVQKILEPAENAEMEASEKEEAKHFVRAYEVMYKLQNLKRDEKILKRYLAKPEKKDSIQDIKKWAASKKIDFPLYAVYRRCKERVAASKQ